MENKGGLWIWRKPTNANCWSSWRSSSGWRLSSSFQRSPENNRTSWVQKWRRSSQPSKALPAWRECPIIELPHPQMRPFPGLSRVGNHRFVCDETNRVFGEEGDTVDITDLHQLCHHRRVASRCRSRENTEADGCCNRQQRSTAGDRLISFVYWRWLETVDSEAITEHLTVFSDERRVSSEKRIAPCMRTPESECWSEYQPIQWCHLLSLQIISLASWYFDIWTYWTHRRTVFHFN